jgi:hypothetical protein
MKNTLLAWVLILFFCLLVVACSGPLAEEDHLKGTIILNFGGVPVTSRAATMGSLVYKYKLFDLDDPDDSDGMKYNGTLSGGRITVDPGNYKIRLTAYLNDAFYADGETTDPVQVTAGSTSSVTITLTVNILTYLGESGSSSAIDLPLAVTLSISKWEAILDAIGTQGTPVNLDLSQCTVPGGTFDPSPGSSTGKELIVSLILPNAVTAIEAGTNSSNPSFAGFNLTTLKIGNNIQTIGAYAFIGVGLTSVALGSSVSVIGSASFQYNNLTSITIPGGVQIGSGAFDYNNDLLDITIGGGCVLDVGAFNNYSQAARVVIGTGGITYSGTTGILGGFDSLEDTPGHIPEGTYIWDSAVGWQH